MSLFFLITTFITYYIVLCPVMSVSQSVSVHMNYKLCLLTNFMLSYLCQLVVGHSVSVQSGLVLLLDLLYVGQSCEMKYLCGTGTSACSLKPITD